MKQHFKWMLALVLLLSLAVGPCATALAAYGTREVYTDQESGAVFLIPEGWQQVPLSKERNTLDAKFTIQGEGISTILYGCTDIWSLLTEETGTWICDRKDMDNSLFTATDIAELYEADPSAVYMVTYAGQAYFALETKMSGQAYGVDVVIPNSLRICVNNGYLYVYSFNGEKDDPHFHSFEELLDSVAY